jgi:hypothetical protein
MVTEGGILYFNIEYDAKHLGGLSMWECQASYVDDAELGKW